MSLFKTGNRVLDDPTYIEKHMLNFYSSLYASDNDYVHNSLIQQVIPSLVSKVDSMMLIAPSSEEIKK